MKKIGFFYLLLVFCCPIFGQNEASYWYFGQNAGLRFDTQAGTVNGITDGQINTLEGCTSISDSDGNLLFYSDGSTVWNRNHQIMFNGTGLRGDDSSTSSGVIVPKPQDPDFYYIFTVDEPHHNNTLNFPNESANDGVNDGLMYSRVNILENGGLGAIDNVEKNIPLITYDTGDPLASELKCSEKITAIKADDCFSFWVISHFQNTFYAFKIDEDGVNPDPVTSVVGPNIPIQGYRRNALGYLKASPDGTKLISANFGESTVPNTDAGGSIYLFDFDNDTGIVSNSIELYSAQNNNSPYGVEFSAENRKAYATIGFGPGGGGTSQVLQWDLEAADIASSIQVVHTSNSFSAGALQLGVDRRIYRAQLDFGRLQAGLPSGQYIGVINNPELDGLAADYDEQGVLLDVNGTNQNLSRIGLPPFIQSLFNSQIDIIRNGESTTELKLCTGENYTLQADDIPGADYIWSFEGTPLAETSSQLFIDTPGFYEVYIEPNNGECPIEGNAVVGIFEIPVANPPSKLTVCDNSGNDGVFAFDFSEKDSEALLAQSPDEYNVRYFENFEDAFDGENEITFPYSNITNPQEIYVRVDNFENTNCFDITSFEIEVFNTPQIVQLNDIEFCDNAGDVTDGISMIELGDLIPIIRGVQDEAETSITFHSTEENAQDNVSPLTLSYTNTNPFNETIFVRIENTTNTACYSTGSFELIVNPIPIANDLSILQCDEDGIPEGFTIYNLTQSINEITGNATNRDVSFHTSLIDAENQENEINGDAFQNYFSPQTIFVRVINNITGCYNIGQLSLETSTTSSNNASLYACDDDGEEDGITTFNLTDTNTIVLAGAPAGLNLQYYETYEDALIEFNPLNNLYTNTIPYNQTIYARVENSNACYGISQIELNVFELPNIETISETRYCLNFFPDPIALNGGVIDDLPSNYSYEWSTGENTSEIEVNSPGTYTVRVFNTNNCFKERTINVLPSNIATISDIEIIDASNDNSISVLVSGEGDYEFALDDIDGPYQDSNAFENVLPGFYTVFVRDKNNCGISEELISVIGFPKFFTPNEDGKNDFWQVKGISSQFQQNSSILIFDRYGKLLKELNPLSSGWDGTVNGIKLPTSDYWFKVNLQDGRTYTNHFTLKR